MPATGSILCSSPPLLHPDIPPGPSKGTGAGLGGRASRVGLSHPPCARHLESLAQDLVWAEGCCVPRWAWGCRQGSACPMPAPTATAPARSTSRIPGESPFPLCLQHPADPAPSCVLPYPAELQHSQSHPGCLVSPSTRAWSHGLPRGHRSAATSRGVMEQGERIREAAEISSAPSFSGEAGVKRLCIWEGRIYG